MENKINIAELLRDCPKGMELDCTIFDTKVIYQGLNKRIPTHPIVIQTKHGLEFELTQYGQIHNIVGSKCVIFPPGKITWDGFIPSCKFKNGDIVFTKIGNIAIISNKINNEKYNSYCVLFECGTFVTDATTVCPERLATEEEKQTLFDAIKANGYRWNEETKTLEKLVEPKFKVGDKVIKRGGITIPVLITNVGEEFYSFNTEHSVGVFSIKEQDQYELVPNKFDITTLKPFDKVLVRGNVGQKWIIDFFGFMDKNKGLPFVCVGHYVIQCIPYENNEHLCGTTNDCDEYYKTWK